MSVSSLAEKRSRFEMLMRTANIPADMIDAFFQEGYIDRVEVSRSNREWTFYFCKRRLLPRDIYASFCRQIREQFAHIARIHFVIHFSDEVDTRSLVEEFWPMFLEWLQREIPSVNGWMTKAEVEVTGSAVHVRMLDATGLELARKRSIDTMIKTFFSRYFGRDLYVKFGVQESSEEQFERFQQQILEEERAFTQHLMAQALEAERSADDAPPEAELKLMLGHEIKDVPVPIEQIQDEDKRVTIQGTVLKLEEKELRNGSTLFQWILTDFTDSLTVKAFAKNKEELQILRLLADGKWVRVRGKVEYDRFMQTPELVMVAGDLVEVTAPPERMDDAEEKRVEFHLHTAMSAMDGITPIGDYVALAAKWGHPAIAVTDHANVQSFPEAYKAAKKHKIKVIYGVEANIVNDAIPIVYRPDDRALADAEFVVFDIETTGLSVINHKIIEIAAVRMANGKEIDRFSTFVNPHERIPYAITQLTSITDEMVKDAPDIEPVIRQFKSFVGGAVLVAHNAQFDIGFVQAALKQAGEEPLTNPVLDTLELARLIHPTLKNHRLNTLTDLYKVRLDNHHRAIDDTLALGEVLFRLLKDAEAKDIARLSDFNRFIGRDLRNVRPFHACIYARNQTGKKNLFKLISLSHTDYFHRVACIPRSKLIELREGLIVTSGCEKGELYETVLNKSAEEAEEVAAFYDVLEVQPIDINMHLVDKGFVTRDQLIEANRRVVEIGKKLGKPVIATGNVHYLHPRDKIYRDITIHGITGFSPLKEIRKPDVHFRTTKEMLHAFEHLGEDAYEVVVTNTRKLAEQFEEIQMFPEQPFFPIIEGADEELRETCYRTAKEKYGDPLPQIIVDRLEKEIVPITKAGFAALYLIAQRLVKKSNEDGYLVGSRGSVGSSIVAMMLGISEVNPLQPHYLCPICKHSEWFTDGSVGSGFDLPDKPCPKCGAMMRGDGQDIPFETFLGFKGDKVPDIDLNFSGEYQPHAHNYTKVLFGEKNVFRAGTIGTVAEKTAYGFVKKYEEEFGRRYRSAEATRLSMGCTGVKRSTGQHPGGIVVVPDYIEVEDITPVQYPADDTSSEWKTTHFDYHAFDANLLKLDILGHDDPTMMRMLQDLTGVDPTTIPMNDPKVMSLFNSTDALGVTPEQIRSSVATYGIPEMGTKFVRQMLEETKPSTFADLLQISGLSHGTGVWLGNAQELIKRGICTISTVIGCRDNIMLYLIYRGMDAALAFKITESVRKGKGLTDEWIEEMKKHDVPDWYIDSCQKIEYMFPRAHAAAYVTSAVRTAYFKLYYPIEFYATYFTVRASEDFDIETFCQGYDGILRKLKEIEDKGFAASAKEKAMVSILEMGLEMTARGFSVKPIDLYRSDAVKFTIDGDALIPPFSAVQGIGANAAKNIAAAREAGEFLSVEDFQTRAKASRTVVEILTGFGCFRGLPESNQLSLF
jgi:DNA polymerase-3 subunit alpha (Gram-positive type)